MEWIFLLAADFQLEAEAMEARTGRPGVPRQRGAAPARTSQTIEYRLKPKPKEKGK